jgi:hypothetical protein
MANLLLAYHGGGTPDTEEAQAEVMQAWVGWFASLGDAVVDAGNPIGRSKTVASDGSVTDARGAGLGHRLQHHPGRQP